MKSVDALAILTRMLVDAEVDITRPSAEDVAKTWRAFEAFAAEPVTDDSLQDDAFLAEFGTRGADETHSPRRFKVSLTRQLTIGGSDEDRDADDELFAELGLDADDEFADDPGSRMFALHCEYSFAPSPELEALGSGNLWSYDCPGGDFFERARTLAGFRVLEDRPTAPVELALSYEEV